MLQIIKNNLEKRAEKKFKKWIANTDVKLEKYRFFSGESIDPYINGITSIDWLIQDFIYDGGKLIYAYAPDVYLQTKQFNNYCLTENENEVKINTLAYTERIVDFNVEYDEYDKLCHWYNILPMFKQTFEHISDMFVRSYEYVPTELMKLSYPERRILSYQNFVKKGNKILDVNSPTLEEEVQDYRNNHINYLISVQYDLIKEFL